MFTLHVFPPSPNGRKVLATCAHLGLQPDVQYVNILEGAQQRPEYRAIHPWGLTPALVEGDLRLWESNAIMLYLAEAHGRGSDLVGRDARERADVARWLFWEAAHWQRAWGPITFERFVRGHILGLSPDLSVIASHEPEFRNLAAGLDAHLARHHYVACDRLTVADFALAAGLIYAAPAALPLADHHHLRAWAARVDELPAWRDTAAKPPG